jgi:hypothetical protein
MPTWVKSARSMFARWAGLSISTRCAPSAVSASATFSPHSVTVTPARSSRFSTMPVVGDACPKKCLAIISSVCAAATACSSGSAVSGASRASRRTSFSRASMRASAPAGVAAFSSAGADDVDPNPGSPTPT